MLKTLCDSFGVAGNEDRIRSIIIEHIKEYVDKIHIDKLGNIIAYKKGANKKTKKILIAAHMDEVGLMIKDINEQGFLSFLSAGGIDKRVLLAKRVKVGEKQIPGVICFKPIHLQRNDYEKIPEMEELYIDIGAKDKKDAMNYVSIGDYAVFDTEFERNGDLLKGKAFDDRFGCFAMIEILKKTYKNDIYAAFTVMEEVGLRGGAVLGENIKHDYAIVFEGTAAADFISERDIADYPKMGEGVVLTISDRTIIVNREFLNTAKKICKRNKIKYQYKQPMIGGTDAGRIHISRTGSKALILAVPSRYIHSPVCFANIKDLKAMIKLGEKLIDSLS